MATIVNNPPANNTNSSGGNGMGFLLGVIILIIFVAVVIIYGLPYIRSMSGFTAQVNVPKSVDVNVNSTK
jgi:hypothetical protein